MLISSLDLFAACVSCVTCVILLRNGKRLTTAERNIVLVVGLLSVVINFSNFLVWFGLSAGASVAENWADYLQVLQPVLWGMFFYVVVQEVQKKLLEESRVQMRDLVENMPVILLAFDQNGKVLAWNQYAETVTGYSKDEVVGSDQMIKKIFPDPEYRQQLLLECRFGGANYHQKVRPIRCKQRYERQVAWSNISKQFPIAGWANWGVGLDITEQALAQKNLEHMATHDELTGLANRALLRDRLAHALTMSQRHKRCGALLLMDLDHFKMVNDSHGHPVGDQLLKEVGERISQCVKATDTLARLGGDEFVILLEQIDRPEEVSMVAERITARITEKPFYLFGNEIRVRFSMGITLFPDDDVRIDELLKNVDLALYAAKENGRNNYHFYSRSMHNKLRWQHRVSEKLRASIESGGFFMEYQPQVDLPTQKVVGVEALLRWNAKEEVPLSPSAFIPIAEKMGMMPALGKWVFESVCEQMSHWRSQGVQAKVSVNLSAVQLYQSNVVESLSRIVNEYHLNPEDIEFEITESAVMRNIDSAINTMKQFTLNGFKLSLDDFGTGYSSLNYLKRFPISKIKIDQSFVRSLETDKVDESIVRSVIDLGHSLNLKVLAEGVETPGQMEKLRNEGCDILQGFYFSHPLKPDSVKGLMQTNMLH